MVTLTNYEHYFPADVAGFDLLVRPGRVAEGMGVLDVDSQPASLVQLHQLLETPGRAHAAEGAYPVLRGAGVVGDGTDAVLIANQLERDGDGFAADRIEGGVYPVGSKLAHSLLESWSVGDRVSAKLPKVVVVPFARGADHSGTPLPGELHGEGANAPRCGVYEHGVALADLQLRERDVGRLARRG